jgi:phosphopantothenoylcysteine decarboxylase/phosphopantothenate--cysteine ligase
MQRSLALSAHPECRAGVFSSAVADYEPEVKAEGKIESGRARLTLDLTPTTKVIQAVRDAVPTLKMITFKYQEQVSHEELMNIVSSRLDMYDAVFANRGEERGPNNSQVGWLCSRGIDPKRLVGKPQIAQGIADCLETLFDV